MAKVEDVNGKPHLTLAQWEVLSGIDSIPKKPRGAGIGKFGGDKHDQKNLFPSPSGQ